MKPAVLLRPHWLFLIAMFISLIYMGVQLGFSYVKNKHDADRIRHIVASEELILKLNKELRQLTRSVENLRLPDIAAQEAFQTEIGLVDVRQPESSDGSPFRAGIQKLTWPLTSHQSADRDQLRMWEPLLQQIAFFSHAKFYFVRGRFEDPTIRTFVTDVGFKGHAKLHNGRWAGVKAKQQVRWERIAQSDGGTPSWKIVE